MFARGDLDLQNIITTLFVSTVSLFYSLFQIYQHSYTGYYVLSKIPHG